MEKPYLSLLHMDLVVGSMDRALAFYQGTLGLTLVSDSLDHGAAVEFVSNGRSRTMRIALLKIAPVGSMLELVELRDDHGAPLPVENVGLYGPTLLVRDLGATIERLARVGLAPVSEVFKVEMPVVGSASLVFYRDPDGRLVELIEVAR